MVDKVKEIFGIPKDVTSSATSEVFGLLPDDVRKEYAKQRQKLIQAGMAGGATQTEAAVGTILGDLLGGAIGKALGIEDPEMAKAEAREANLANLRETLKNPTPESLMTIGLDMVASSSADDRAFGASLVKLSTDLADAAKIDVKQKDPTNEERTATNNMLEAWAKAKGFDLGDLKGEKVKEAAGVTESLAIALESLKSKDIARAERDGTDRTPTDELFNQLMNDYLAQGKITIAQDTGLFGTGMLKGDPEIQFNLFGDAKRKEQEAVRNESMGMDATGQTLTDDQKALLERHGVKVGK